MRKTFFTAVSLLAAITGTSARPHARASLDAATLAKVRTNAMAINHKSWEVGTLTEALLEYSWPQLSVFGGNPIPPSKELFTSHYPEDVIKIATDIVAKKASDSPTLVVDGAVGDPASIGPAVLLANWTRKDPNDNRFSAAVASQLDFLLNKAPHSNDGAISHRSEEVQLWSDFVYMVPPFLALYGAYEQGDAKIALLQNAYDQCRLYRQYMRDSATNLWRHIELGSWQDKKLWATGNAWAAAGMIRVLQTIRNSDVSERFQAQQNDLIAWTEEILKASWDRQSPAGAIRNLIDDPNSFEDTASTALLASVAFRLAVIKGDSWTYIPKAHAAYDFVHRNIDKDGWLRNAVDPLKWNVAASLEEPSPEAQSFVLLLEAARRDFHDWVPSLWGHGY